MLTVVIVIHLMIVLALIGVVLLQKSEGGGLGMGGGGGGGFLSSRGTANVLTRTTAILAIGLFHHQPDAFDAGGARSQAAFDHRSGGGTPASRPAPGSPAPLGRGGGLLDTLRGGEPAPPAPAGAPPSEPQVPRSQ